MADDVGYLSYRYGHNDVEVVSGRVALGAPAGSTRLALAMDIPKHVAISEFCAFVERDDAGIVHMQVVDPGDDCYAVFVVLASVGDCDAFCEALDGVAFNSVEEERCRVVRVHEDSDQVLLCSAVSCPVCLDSIDGHGGSISILCRHQFHYRCLRKWKDHSNVCPVCRYHMQPQV